MWELVLLAGIFAGAQTLRYYGHKSKRHRAYTLACPPPVVEENDIIFKGSESGITAEQAQAILLKRFAYYRLLADSEKQRFLQRLQSFMNKKTFIIKNDEGYKEMPVLVSAAAIQLTFGLKHYLLPFYQYIRIYPKEYFSEHALFTVLAGNVKDNIVTVAWNQLLHGYEIGTDGCNVGLHEMSHALYIQKMVIEENYATDFCRRYKHLLTQSKQAHSIEKDGGKDLYSGYAETNLQEFWAETVELFFERPAELRTEHPGVFNALTLLLNQDPAQKDYPVCRKQASLIEKNVVAFVNWINNLRRDSA